MAAGPRPCPIWRTEEQRDDSEANNTQFPEKWDLSRSDPAQIEVRGVRQSHPTLVSQGFGSLALLRFGLEPAKTSFEDTP